MPRSNPKELKDFIMVSLKVPVHPRQFVAGWTLNMSNFVGLTPFFPICTCMSLESVSTFTREIFFNKKMDFKI
jgi:hypothetical protein